MAFVDRHGKHHRLPAVVEIVMRHIRLGQGKATFSNQQAGLPRL